MFVVLFLSVLLIATCGRLSWQLSGQCSGALSNSAWLCDWLIDQFLKIVFVIIASSCILSPCAMSARHQCEASTWRLDAHFATVVRGCCRGCRCRFRRPWSCRCWLDPEIDRVDRSKVELTQGPKVDSYIVFYIKFNVFSLLAGI